MNSVKTVARVASVATRMPLAVVPRRMASGGHHNHRVFEPPYNPWGAPAYIMGFVVFGGLGVSGIAWAVQMGKWTPSK